MSFTSRQISSKITFLKSNWSLSSTKSTGVEPPVSVLFMPFLGAKPKHHKPYLKLYEDLYSQSGRRVEFLVVQASIRDFLSISKGKDLSTKVLDLVSSEFDPSSKLIAHGMSVGNFLHAVNLQNDVDNRYQNKLHAQIYDSPVYGGPISGGGLERIVDAIVETALSNTRLKNKLTQKMIMKGARLAIIPNAAVFDNYITQFLSKSTIAPILTFYSQNDLMIDPLKYEIVIQEWKDKGVDVCDCCFEKSVHAQHIIRHPVIFKQHFVKFLTDLKL